MSKKRASSIVSGAGFVAGFFTDLVAEVRRAGGTDEDIYRLATADGKSTLAELAGLIVAKPAKAMKSAAKTFAELLAACRQGWVNPDFNEANFPLEPVAPDEDDWEVYEYHFKDVVTGEQAMKELEAMGYRLLGGSRRGLEFLAKNSDLQMDHPLVITARWQDPLGSWRAPIANRNDVRRDLNLDYLVYDFNPNYGWLVLRKRG